MVPDIAGPVSGLVDFLITEQDKSKKLAREQQTAEDLRTVLGGDPEQAKQLGTVFGDTPTESPGLSILGQLAPEVAQEAVQVAQSRDPQAIKQFRAEATRGMKLAKDIQGANTFADKQRLLGDETARVVAQGGDTSRLVELSNLSEDEFNLQLETMGVVGKAVLDAVPEVREGGPLRFLQDKKSIAAFSRLPADQQRVLLAARGQEIAREAQEKEAERLAAGPQSVLGRATANVRSDIARGFISPEVGGRRLDRLNAEATAVDRGTPLTAPGKAQSDFEQGFITQDQLNTINNTPVEFQTDMAKLLIDQKNIGQIFGEGSPQAAAMAEQVNSVQQGEKPKLSDVGGMRKEFTSLSGDFITMRDAMGKIAASAENPSPAGDLSLIFNFMKILDPNSVVRESEFATAENTGSIPDRVWRQYNKMLEGERLAPPMRADFVDTAANLFRSGLRSQQVLENKFSRIATRSNIDPRDVVINFKTPAEGGGDTGGATGGATGGTAAKSNIEIVNSFDNLNFVQRIKDPNRAVIQNPDGSVSTHRMAAEVDENGNWFAFPTIVEQPNGELKEFDTNQEAMDFALRTGENIPFGRNKAKALDFARGGYKDAAPDMRRGRGGTTGGDLTFNPETGRLE